MFCVEPRILYCFLHSSNIGDTFSNSPSFIDYDNVLGIGLIDDLDGMSCHDGLSGSLLNKPEQTSLKIRMEINIWLVDNQHQISVCL